MLGGHYERFAQVIIHSVLQEGPAYPHFPKAVYYYMLGGVEEAVRHLNTSELPMYTQYVVEQVS